MHPVRWARTRWMTVGASAVMAAAVAGCGLFGRRPRDEGAPAAVQPVPPLEENAALQRGRQLFDEGRLEEAALAFEAAAADSVAAAEARAFLTLIEVLQGRAPAEKWQVRPAYVSDPVEVARLGVEGRFLLVEAQRLLREGRADEALKRLERLERLIDAAPAVGIPPPR